MGLKKATVKLGADISEFTNKMQKASRSFKKMGKNIQRAGKTMSMSLTAPLTAFAAASIKAFDTQAKAEAKLMTALHGNKKAFDNLTKSARALQNVTTFGDEEIIAQQAYLASLGLTTDQIKEVIAASMDLAAGTGQTLEFGVRNLAKTFGGLTGELGESIPALKNLTKEQLMAGEAVDVVAKQFKGQAEAAAQAGAGGLKQLSNRFGDLMEKIGELLLPILNKLVSFLDSTITSFNNLDSGVKIAIVTLGGLLAAIGPLVTLFGGLVSVVSFFMTPLGAAIAGIAALAAAAIYVSDNLEVLGQIGKMMAVSLGNAFLNIGQMLITPFELAIDGINKVLSLLGKKEFKNPFTSMKDGLEGLKGEVPAVSAKFGSFGDAVSNAATKAKNALFGLGTSVGVGSDVGVQGGDAPITLIEMDVDEIEEEAEVLDTTFGDALLKTKDKIDDLKESAKNFGLAMVNDFANSFSQAIVSGEGFIVSMGNIFKELAKQIAAMLVKAALLAAVFSLIPGLGAAQTAAGGATSFSGLLSGMMGGIPGRASGGFVNRNTPYIVGERGPELFVPSSSGGIVANHNLGGGTVIPDVRISGDDLLIVFDRANRRKARR